MTTATAIVPLDELEAGMKYLEDPGGTARWMLIEDISDTTAAAIDEETGKVTPPYRCAMSRYVDDSNSGYLCVVRVFQGLPVSVDATGEPILYPLPTTATGEGVGRFTAANGVCFAVRIVPTGSHYAHDLSLTAEEPMVEFYDARYAGQRNHHIWGQFIARYRIDTVAVGGDGTGLDLDGGVDAWTVDAATMDDVRKWVRRTVVAAYNGAAKFFPYERWPEHHADGASNYQCIEVAGVQVYVYVQWLDSGPTLVVSPHFDTTDPGLVDPATSEVRIAMKNGVGDVIYS